MIVGPIIAILSFVCSVGNVPLAAVLWSGGISFGGVMAFIFADLIVLPILAIYRKYYGWSFALRISALMFVTMALAALIIDGAFRALGIIPTARPSRADIFQSIQLDYKLVLAPATSFGDRNRLVTTSPPPDSVMATPGRAGAAYGAL